MTAFIKTIEDFVCARCDAKVAGNGYTNHCPECLWSRHVDENPGDRASLCKEIMEPVAVLLKAGEWTILHRCVSCGFERAQKAEATDNQEALAELSLSTAL